MSTTTFTGTATCEVAPDFNLDTYLDTLCDFVQNHLEDLPDNLQTEFEDMTVDELKAELGNYLSLNREYLWIECDTDESNGNSEIWEFLIDQVSQDVMKDVMEVYSTISDSRSGVDPWHYYITKTNHKVEVHYPEDIVKILKQRIQNETESITRTP